MVAPGSNEYRIKSIYSNLFNMNTFLSTPGLLDNNLERRPITIELNLNAVTLCGGESLPVSSLTFDP